VGIATHGGGAADHHAHAEHLYGFTRADHYYIDYPGDGLAQPLLPFA
jgi:hypothetical protein